ncbi:MAG: cupin domain-containing protein [Chloroflexi bacterium]|nr:cupin domain-containing protein [Chloroflexota bacterium]
MYVVNRDALPTFRYEGAEHGPATVSILFSESDPGDGPRLHRHPYDETWIVQEGQVQVWIGEEAGEARAGDIAVAPPNTPHKFKNIGEGVARLICIHASSTVSTEWLE